MTYGPYYEQQMRKSIERGIIERYGYGISSFSSDKIDSSFSSDKIDLPVSNPDNSDEEILLVIADERVGL